MTHIGEKIRQARIAKGFTQGELAESLGIDAPNVSRWESGKTTPRPKLVPLIAEVLGKPVEWFQGASEDTALESRLAALEARMIGAIDASPEEEELLALFKVASDDKRRAILGYIRSLVAGDKSEAVPQSKRS